MYVGEVDEMMCVSLTEGHSCDGCDLASTLCKYNLRKGDYICSELSKGATSEWELSLQSC